VTGAQLEGDAVKLAVENVKTGASEELEANVVLVSAGAGRRRPPGCTTAYRHPWDLKAPHCSSLVFLWTSGTCSPPRPCH